MAYLPLFLKLHNQPALLVGGGVVAYRKARALQRACARIHVIAEHFSEDMTALATQDERITLSSQTAVSGDDIAAFRVVIAATDDSAFNHDIAHKAAALNIPVNVVDDPDYSTFLMPAIIDRSPLLIAISSAGKAPVLARKIRQQIEQLVPSRMGRVVTLAGQLRARVAQAVKHNRRQFWERLFSSWFTRHVLRGEENRARQVADQLLDGYEAPAGMVYLTGAGPGDPELLTLKAVNILQQADVILYDKLVNPQILDKARRDANFICVGKSAGHSSTTQADIHELMRKHACQGEVVCRLKGGDPFIFGRGGEEIIYLQQHGIAWEVIPGITAAIGCAASAGLPLTHRDAAQSVRLTAAKSKHDSPGDLVQNSTGETLAIYMGLNSATSIQNQLLAQGYPADRPVAIITQGTTVTEQTITGTLGKLAELVSQCHLSPPAMIYVGKSIELMAANPAGYEPAQTDSCCVETGANSSL